MVADHQRLEAEELAEAHQVRKERRGDVRAHVIKFSGADRHPRPRK